MVTLTGANASISAATALKLGVNTLSGSLTAVANSLDLGSGSIGTSLKANTNGGDITQTGALTVGTTTTLDAAAGLANITLTQANDFKGAVNTGLAGTVKVTDANDLTITAATTKADLVLRSTGALILGTVTVGGKLDAGSAGGDITQIGVLSVTGSSALDAGAGAIALTRNDNALTGAVALTGGDVKLANGGALVLGVVKATDLTVFATNDITQVGAATVSGTTDVTRNGGTKTVLDNAGNDFGGPVFVASGLGGSTTVVDKNDLVVNSNGPGDLTAQATGSLVASLGGRPQVANLQAGTTLTVSGISGQVNTVSGGATTLGNLNLDQNLKINSGGAVTQQGGTSLTVQGTTTIAAGANPVTLANPTNDFVGAVGITGGDIAVVDANDLNATAIVPTAGKNLTLEALGGQLNVAGGAINLGAGALKLTSATGLDTTGAPITAAAVTLNAGTGTLTLGDNITTTGVLSLTAAKVDQTAGKIEAPAGATVTATGAVSLNGAANDFTGPVVLTGTAVQITDANALTLGAVQASSLAVTTSGKLDQSAPIAVTGATTINTGAADVVLTDAGNDFAGPVSVTSFGAQIVDKNALSLGTVSTANLAVTSTGALNLGQGSVTGTLDATSNGGAITQSGPLQVSFGDANINAGTGTITLNDAGNDFGFAVSLTGGATKVTDKNSLTLGTLATGDLTLTSTGALNLGQGKVSGNLVAGANTVGQSGALTVTGTSNLNTGGLGPVTLADAGNDFQGKLTVSGTSTIVDKNDLDVAASGIGAHNIQAGGALTAAIGGGPSAFVLKAGTDLTVGGFTGELTTTSGGTTTLNALNFGLGSGKLTINSGGAVTQTGAAVVTGAAAVNAAGQAVTLTDAGNDFKGGLSVTGAATKINNANALGLTSVTATSLDVVAGGAVSAGVLTVSGTTSVDAGAGAITLTNAANDFGGVVSLTGGATQIADKNALTLGTLATGDLSATSAGQLDLGQGKVGGNLQASSGGLGPIAQTGPLTVTGTSDLNAGGFGVLLANAGNDFQGTVKVVGIGVQLADKNAIDLGAGSVNLLQVTTANGAITQSGALVVSVDTKLNAGTGDITLTNAGNDFTGPVTLTGGAVKLADKSALELGAVTATSLALNAGGALTQSAALSVAGTTTADAGANAVTLTNPANDFGAAVAVTGGAVKLTDAGSLVLGATTASSLDLKAGGDITQTGAVKVAGAATADAGTNAITLTDAANDFAGTLALTGGATQVTGAGALDVKLDTGATTLTAAGALTVAGQVASLNTNAAATTFGTTDVVGALQVKATGAVTQIGALTTGASSSVDAGGNAITLTDAGNQLAGTTTLVGGSTDVAAAGDLKAALTTGATTLSATGALGVSGSAASLKTTGVATDFGATTVTGALTTVATGAVTQSGALKAGAGSSIDAGANAITLADAGNDFSGTLSLTGGATQVADASALDVALNTGATTLNAVGALTVSGKAAALTTTGGDTSFGATTVVGALNTVSSGAITQTGALVTGASSKLDAGAAGSITLNGAGNSLGGTTTLVGGATQLNVDGALKAVLSTGTTTLSAGGALAVSGTAATLSTKAGATEFGATNVAGALDAVAAGAVTQTGTLKTGAASSVNAVGERDHAGQHWQRLHRHAHADRWCHQGGRRQCSGLGRHRGQPGHHRRGHQLRRHQRFGRAEGRGHRRSHPDRHAADRCQQQHHCRCQRHHAG